MVPTCWATYHALYTITDVSLGDNEWGLGSTWWASYHALHIITDVSLGNKGWGSVTLWQASYHALDTITDVSLSNKVNCIPDDHCLARTCQLTCEGCLGMQAIKVGMAFRCEWCTSGHVDWYAMMMIMGSVMQTLTEYCHRAMKSSCWGFAEIRVHSLLFSLYSMFHNAIVMSHVRRCIDRCHGDCWHAETESGQAVRDVQSQAQKSVEATYTSRAEKKGVGWGSSQESHIQALLNQPHLQP